MTIATGLGPAVMQLARVSRAMYGPGLDGSRSDERLARLRRTTEYADYAAAEAHSEALELELRGADGSIIATDWIAIRDAQRPLSMDENQNDDNWSPDDIGEFDPKREDALEKAIEADCALLEEMLEGSDAPHDWDESAESDLPRYQIHVRLIDNRSVP